MNGLTIREPEMDGLVNAILGGDAAAAVAEAESLKASGVGIECIVVNGIESAMSALDAKCTLEQFNLLEIMLAGRAVTEVMKRLVTAGDPNLGRKGTVVTATLEGDVHDLGKNIHRNILSSKGYRVIDCGKDCPLDRLIDTVERERPLAVAVSGLITPVIPLVRQVKKRLTERGLASVKVIAGGAALKQSSSERLNVDYVAESAFDSLHFLDSLPRGGKS